MERVNEPLVHRFGCGVLLLDLEGRISFANESARSVLGLTDKDLLRKTDHPFGWRMRSIDEEPLSAEEHPFARALMGESYLGLEVKIKRPDKGEECALSINGSPLRNDRGEIEGAIFDFNDITEKKKAQEIIRRAKEQLEVSEGRLRALVGSIDEIVFEFDAEGNYLHVWAENDALLKRPRQELIGVGVKEVVGEEVGIPILEALKRVFTSGEAESLEYCLDVLGGRRWFLARVARIPAQGDQPPTLSFLARDITGRREMEEELRASRRQFQQMLENVRLAALVLDLEGRVKYCNDHLLHLLDRTRGEVEGKGWVENFVPPEEREALRWMCERVLAQGELPTYHENHILTRSGEKRLLAWNNILLHERKERVVGCASIAEDITERRRAEEVLRRSSTMKSEFIAVAAHELRTPLTSILGYSELLLQQEEFGGFDALQQREFLQEIQAKGELLSRIVNQLLDLSRLDSGQPILLELKPCNLHEVLEREIRNYRIHHPEHRFILDAREKCPEGIQVDRDHMEQVLQNLLSNAVKYSRPGSTVRLKGVLEAQEYIVSVSDEGIGMSREQAQKIFDRFYRVDMSDTAVSGLGLGMSIVRGIIEGHGGSIWVQSAPGKGTTVFFSLPVNNRPLHRG